MRLEQLIWLMDKGAESFKSTLDQFRDRPEIGHRPALFVGSHLHAWKIVFRTFQGEFSVGQAHGRNQGRISIDRNRSGRASDSNGHPGHPRRRILFHDQPTGKTSAFWRILATVRVGIRRCFMNLAMQCTEARRMATGGFLSQ